MQRGLCDFLQWWCPSEGHQSWTSTPWLQIFLWTHRELLRTSHAAKIIGFPGVLDLGNRFRRINHHSAHGIFFQRGLRPSGHGLKVIDSRKLATIRRRAALAVTTQSENSTVVLSFLPLGSLVVNHSRRVS